MTDIILEEFLRTQLEEITAFAAESDMLSVEPVEDGPLPRRYLCRFRCRGLVDDGAGEPRETEEFLVMIQLPDDYLRRVRAFQIVTVLRPLNIFHPNCLYHGICLGRLQPGTPLVEIVYQVQEIISFHRFSTEEPLNPQAARWVRNQLADPDGYRFPLDRRPLRRRRSAGNESETPGGGKGAA